MNRPKASPSDSLRGEEPVPAPPERIYMNLQVSDGADITLLERTFSGTFANPKQLGNTVAAYNCKSDGLGKSKMSRDTGLAAASGEN